MSPWPTSWISTGVNCICRGLIRLYLSLLLRLVPLGLHRLVCLWEVACYLLRPSRVVLLRVLLCSSLVTLDWTSLPPWQVPRTLPWASHLHTQVCPPLLVYLDL